MQIPSPVDVDSPSVVDPVVVVVPEDPVEASDASPVVVDPVEVPGSPVVVVPSPAVSEEPDDDDDPVEVGAPDDDDSLADSVMSVIGGSVPAHAVIIAPRAAASIARLRTTPE